MITASAVAVLGDRNGPPPGAGDSHEISGRPAFEGKLHALVVEDDESFCSIISIVLSHASITCDVARDARSAREFLNRRLYDAYIIDLRLPDCAGDEVVSLLLSKDPDARNKSIVVTAFPVTAAAFSGGLPVIDKASLAGLRTFVAAIRTGPPQTEPE